MRGTLWLGTKKMAIKKQIPLDISGPEDGSQGHAESVHPADPDSASSEVSSWVTNEVTTKGTRKQASV